MATEKRENPYQRLKRECQQWANKVLYRPEKIMFTYPAEKLEKYNYDLKQVHERVMAAQQIGYKVEIKANSEGLRIVYKERISNPPFELFN